MKDLLMQQYDGLTLSLSLEVILMSFIVATALAGLVYLAYRITHSGAVYSARFNVTLVMLTIITTLIMSVIGNNVALSLGMVGALSIIRFRTAVKDPRDTAFIFWAIAIGICCGVSQYVVAMVGSVFIFVVMFAFGSLKSNDRYLLIVRGGKECIEEVEKAVLVAFEGKAKTRVKNTNATTVEFIFEVSQFMVEKASKRNDDVITTLSACQGVEQVNLVVQNEEISR